MGSLSKAIGDAFSECKNWIAQNPSKLRTWESRIYIIAQVLLGKFGNTKLQTEWLRSAYKLVSLFNGLIILHSSEKKSYDAAERVNICVAVLEHCEIALEKSAEQVLGPEGRWSVIKYLQLIKFLAKVTLVLHFKEKITGHPCVASDHNTSSESSSNSSNVAEFQCNQNDYIKLKHSGRLMRTVESAPPLNYRVWKPPERRTERSSLTDNIDNEVRDMQFIGEVLYIMKPIINLALIRRYGPRNWKQWTFSLFMDLLSLYFLNFPARRRNMGNMSTGLTPVEMSIMAQRRANLLFYLVRSPFFQRKIATPLFLGLNMLPFIGPVLSEELQFYLSSYFFLWSS